MFKIIPQPDLYNYSMMVSFLIHGVALAVLILMNTIIWIAIAFCGNFGHKVLLRYLTKFSITLFTKQFIFTFTF